jgi:rod shape determining protein RodA
MVDRRFLLHFDWWLCLCVFCIMVVGFINLSSASLAAGYPFHLKQLWWYIGGTFLMFIFAIFDYRVLFGYSIHIYLVTVLLLVLVLFIGTTVGGSQRWLSLGFFNIQPSEFAKLAIVIVLSSYFYHDDRAQYGLKDLWRPLLLILLPVFLIYRQPDLGTAVLLLIILGSVFCMARLRWTFVITAVGLLLAAIPLCWKLLKPYQRRRIETFLDPELDPFGSGYHVLQSKIAVGSGEIWGKGFGAGTQAHLNFLPEVHTDFAFSVWSEEWGMVGSLILLGLYFVVLCHGLTIAAQSKERFGSFLAFGVTAMLFWQVMVNVCMVTGLMPVVGVPLPLFSYGGSSVITSLLGIGLLQNVRARRFLFHAGGRPP